MDNKYKRVGRFPTERRLIYETQILEEILTNSIENTRVRYDGLLNSLQGYLDVVSSNRAELFPPEPEPVVEKKPEKVSRDKDPDDLEPIDLSVVNIKND